MNLRAPFVALSTAILFAACSTDVAVAPMKVPTGASLALSAGTESGSYIVFLKGNSAAGFAEKVAALGGTVTYVNANAGFATISGIPAGAAARLGAINGVTDVEADEAITLDSPTPDVVAHAALMSEPSVANQENPAAAILFGRQWNMRLIHAPEAWATGRVGSPTVKVAILDTGIDYNSLDSNTLVEDSTSTSFMRLYVRAATHADSLLTPHQDTVRADNYVQATFFPTRKIYTDFNGHGTNVASQVSSIGFAFAGVTSKTTLMAVKVLQSNGTGSLGTVLSGVLFAADHGANVANMSLGGAFSKSGNGRAVSIINRVFNYAKQKGMLIVVAAGNSGGDIQHSGNVQVNYCDAPHVLCVSAVGPSVATENPDTPAYYTNYGKSVIDVAAPGGNGVPDASGNLIPSPGWPWGVSAASWVYGMCAKNALFGFTATDVPILLGCQSGGAFIGYIGTSQASPHVAGLAALLIAENGKGNPMMIKKLIERSGDPMDPDLGGAFGNTRINVQRALGL